MNAQKETVKFLGKEVALPRKSTEKAPMKGKSVEGIQEIGYELLKSYTEQAQEQSFLSNHHKQKVDSFFENTPIGFNSSDEVLEASEKAQSTEDLTFPNNPALYTTVVRGIIERAFRPALVMANAIKTINVNPSGMQDLQVPVSALRTAQDLPNSGDLSQPNNTDYSSVKITLNWIYSYEVITIQLLRQGIADVVQDQMFELGDALARKVDSDIISAIETATPTDDSNNNYKSVSGDLAYTDLVDAVFDHQNNDAQTDVIITTPLVWGKFLQDSNVISALGFNSTEQGTVFPKIMQFSGVRVVLTTNASTNNVYLIDSTKAGYLVEGSGIEMLDGRQSSSVNTEIIGLKLFGVDIVQPASVYRIEVNQST